MVSFFFPPSKSHKQKGNREKYVCVCVCENMLKRSTIVEGYIIMENTFRGLVMGKERVHRMKGWKCWAQLVTVGLM